MISESKKFLFIHYPKTGGNSIQKALLEYSVDALVPTHFTRRSGYNEDFRTYNSNYKTHKHSTLNNYRQELEPELFKSLFKFTTVRNPWDRMISYYFSPHRQNSEWNREDFVEFVKKIPVLRLFTVSKSNFRTIRKFNNFRYRYRIPGMPLDAEMDFIMKFENLENDFLTVCKRLGIPEVSLPKLNKSKRKHYSNYYDDELVKLVGNRFWEEVKFGNYKFERN